MGKLVSMRCPTCGGCGMVDDHFDSERGEWVQRWCSSCSGTGEVTEYQCDDGTYSGGWW